MSEIINFWTAKGTSSGLSHNIDPELVACCEYGSHLFLAERLLQVFSFTLERGEKGVSVKTLSPFSGEEYVGDSKLSLELSSLSQLSSSVKNAIFFAGKATVDNRGRSLSQDYAVLRVVESDSRLHVVPGQICVFDYNEQYYPAICVTSPGYNGTLLRFAVHSSTPISEGPLPPILKLQEPLTSCVTEYINCLSLGLFFPTETPVVTAPQAYVTPSRLSLDPANELKSALAQNRQQRIVLLGPPGTGKTQLLAECLASSAYGHRILVVAHSNSAVDTILERLMSITQVDAPSMFDAEVGSARRPSDLTVVRVGRWNSTSPAVRRFHVNYLALQQSYQGQRRKQKWIDKGERGIPEGFKGDRRLAQALLSLLQQSSICNLVYEHEVCENEARLGIPFARVRQRGIIDQLDQATKALRGNASCNAAIACLSSLLTPPRAPEKVSASIIGAANITFSTLSSVLSIHNSFGSVIVDESSQAPGASVMAVAGMGAKLGSVQRRKLEAGGGKCVNWGPNLLIICGDPAQLQPIAGDGLESLRGISAIDYTLGADSESVYQNLDNYPVLFLQNTHRMIAPVCDVVSKLFYGGRLSSTSRVIPPEIPKLGTGVVFIDSESREARAGNSFCNKQEALLLSNAIKFVPSGKRVLILTPYTGQIPVLRNTMPQEYSDSISTIDSAQGSESDVVFISLVRSQSIGFLSDYHRLCVALSRARFLVVLLGCRRLLEVNSLWKSLFTMAKMFTASDFPQQGEPLSSQQCRQNSDRTGSLW